MIDNASYSLYSYIIITKTIGCLLVVAFFLFMFVMFDAQTKCIHTAVWNN